MAIKSPYQIVNFVNSLQNQEFSTLERQMLPMLNDQTIKENDKLLIFLLFQLESFYNFPSHFWTTCSPFDVMWHHPISGAGHRKN
jgi:hypothetical protein